jgi:hypothetical protein
MTASTIAKLLHTYMSEVDSRTNIRVTHSGNTITAHHAGDVHPAHFDIMHSMVQVWSSFDFHLVPVEVN